MSWSYYHARPRAQVHYEKYGTYAVPPRQYRMGGRRFAQAGLANGTSWMLIAAVLLGAWLLMKKK